MLLKLKKGCLCRPGLARPFTVYQPKAKRPKRWPSMRIPRTPHCPYGSKLLFNLKQMLHVMNMCGWDGIRKKRKRKKKKSLWICSSCTTMRLNSANNQQDKRKETGDGGFESAGKGRLFSFASDKWGPFPVLFFYAPFPHGALTKPYSQGFKTFKNPAFFLFFFLRESLFTITTTRPRMFPACQ